MLADFTITINAGRKPMAVRVKVYKRVSAGAIYLGVQEFKNFDPTQVIDTQ